MWCPRGEKKWKENKQLEILHCGVRKNKVNGNLSVKRRCGDGNDEHKDCQRESLVICKAVRWGAHCKLDLGTWLPSSKGSHERKHLDESVNNQKTTTINVTMETGTDRNLLSLYEDLNSQREKQLWIRRGAEQMVVIIFCQITATPKGCARVNM